MSILFPAGRYFKRPATPPGFPLKGGWRRRDLTAFFRFGHREWDGEWTVQWSWAIQYYEFPESLFVQLMAAPEKGKFFSQFCRRIYNPWTGDTTQLVGNHDVVGYWKDTGLARLRKRKRIDVAGFDNVDYDEWPSDLDLEFEYKANLITP